MSRAWKAVVGCCVLVALVVGVVWIGGAEPSAIRFLRKHDVAATYSYAQSSGAWREEVTYRVDRHALDTMEALLAKDEVRELARASVSIRRCGPYMIAVRESRDEQFPFRVTVLREIPPSTFETAGRWLRKSLGLA